jgi:hypothetical protein
MEKNISDDGNELIEGLMRLGIPALQQTHRELFGTDCTVLHVLYLRRKLAWELQMRAQGSLSEESRQHALGIAWQTTLRTRARSHASRSVNATISLGHDTRLPPKKSPKTPNEPGTPREGSKTSQVIAMLKREGGTTLEEIMSAMGWLKHTTRAMLSAGGSLKGKEAHEQRKDKRHNKVSQRDSKREEEQTRPAGHPNSRNKPDRGGGSKTLDLILPYKYKTGADKADAGHNLRSNTRRIKNNTTVSKNIHKAVPRNQHEKGSGRPSTCRTRQLENTEKTGGNARMRPG